MTYATCFSGIGGWELGLNACGWQLQWQCECDPFCRTLLAERFGVPIYEDIRTIRKQNPPPVDALIGSPPCQPFSVAGKKRGVGDERHLYPAFIRLVGQIRPRWVLMEQVPAILSLDGGRAFGEYVGGLAALGYDLVWHCLPACAVGAPHRRDRVWIIAHRDERGTHAEQEQGGECAGEADIDRDGEAGVVADNSGKRSALGRLSVRSRGSQQAEVVTERGGEDVAESGGERDEWRGVRCGYEAGAGASCEAEGRGAVSGHPERAGLEGGRERGAIGDTGWWAVEPDVGRVAHGISFRVDRLKGLGNAIVPQIPFLIGQAINQIEQ